MKNQAYIEHINITVNNLENTIRFIQTALPEFKVRGGGEDTRKWVHIGTDSSYLAINEAVNKIESNETYHQTGYNHLGIVVNDASEIVNRLESAGYKRSYPKTEDKYRIREYFLDDTGLEYEFIQYLSEKPEERNDYSDLTSK